MLATVFRSLLRICFGSLTNPSPLANNEMLLVWLLTHYLPFLHSPWVSFSMFLHPCFLPFLSWVSWLWRSWYQKYFWERWKLCEDRVKWVCSWLVRYRGGLRLWKFSACGILGWMFKGSHYGDASLAFALLSIIDKWIWNLRALYHG